MAFHAQSVYRLRIVGNKILNCNRSNNQWTGSIVEILSGGLAEFRDNWIIEDIGTQFHKKPFVITSERCVQSNNLVR